MPSSSDVSGVIAPSGATSENFAASTFHEAKLNTSSTRPAVSPRRARRRMAAMRSLSSPMLKGFVM